MVEEWLRRNEIYQLPEGLKEGEGFVDLDYYEEDGFLTSLRVEVLKTQYSQYNNGSLALRNVRNLHPRRGLCFIDEKLARNQQQYSAIKKPHTAHIFAPATLNVSYINPIPWKHV
ncbi:hypothetical protein O3M35_002218 [Rhynocoris fuscipes]